MVLLLQTPDGAEIAKGGGFDPDGVVKLNVLRVRHAGERRGLRVRLSAKRPYT